MPEPDYFLLSELRALPQMSDTGTYTDARCLAAAAYITGILEREVSTSFVPRTVTDEVHDGGRDVLLLNKPHVLSVTSATENGVAVTDDLRVSPGGLLRRFAAGSYSVPLVWAAGVGNVSVTYQAGYSTTPPPDVKEAVIQGTRARLLATNSNAQLDDRRTSMSTENGTIQFVIAGEKRPTGFPEVDAVILGWQAKLAVHGFA